MNDHVIPIHHEAPATHPGCGQCGSRPDAEDCHNPVRGLPCAEPRLDGPPQLLAQLLGALGGALDAEASGCIRPRDYIHALRVDADEAELQLGVRPDAAGIALMDTAFQTLRRLLPDTDIYVLPLR